MDFDFTMAIGSFLVAIVVGLTGMGGGALMTPMLVTFFGVPPLTAVSSDLVAAAVMKPVGGLVHLRRGTVDLRLVGWLCAGSIPAAFCGVLVARLLGDGDDVQNAIQKALGVALLLAAAGLAVRGYLALKDRASHPTTAPANPTTTTEPRPTTAEPRPASTESHPTQTEPHPAATWRRPASTWRLTASTWRRMTSARRRTASTGGPTAWTRRPTARTELRTASTARRTAAPGEPASIAPPQVTVRPVPTVVIGAVGGLVVGMTSVGSGSLIIVALLAVYPALRANQLVGTDLVQAVPLVMSAAIGHLLFGDFQLSVTTALLAGSVPGVYIGSRISSRAPGGLIRRVLAFVLLASALKMFGAGNALTVGVLGAVLLAAPLLWMFLRTRNGLPAFPWAKKENFPADR
ncbi:sulfite exporter TauE/SafE family protein [Sphaerisporangium corydalis]|uniref:Probable membrane transporter protein n=1 Tax=Sphaerisporangium corydalis TaxID=1441875 RepID=A0ABV9EH86_9ACTN